ncbi:N-formyl peptide receptor 2-like [Tenrec ecaudatus]|uniref:N-formyl peptide receptor 2-like n=1 Tax=Tenrec ecaudatus TaxID=94439 RepID=UPI003F59CFDD
MKTNFSIAQDDYQDIYFVLHNHTILYTLSLLMLGITFVLGMLGNGLVIWVAGFRMARTVTTISYLNLALADFSFTATLPFQIVWMIKKQWPFGWLLFKLVHIVSSINLYGSIFLITAIALDRCICVLHPIWARNHRTVGLAKRVIIGLWILALVFTLPGIFMTSVNDKQSKIHCLINFTSWCNTTEESMASFITISMTNGIVFFILGFCTPMSIITICYGLIAVDMHKRGLIKSSRPLRVLTAVVVSFFLCWFPSQLVILLHTVWLREIMYNGKYKILGVLTYPASCLAFFNSCLNPMLYVFVGQNFQKRLIQSLPASLERALSEDSGQTGVPTATSASPSSKAELQAV